MEGVSEVVTFKKKTEKHPAVLKAKLSRQRPDKSKGNEAWYVSGTKDKPEPQSIESVPGKQNQSNQRDREELGHGTDGKEFRSRFYPRCGRQPAERLSAKKIRDGIMI